jgi:hypothetical protein
MELTQEDTRPSPKRNNKWRSTKLGNNKPSALAVCLDGWHKKARNHNVLSYKPFFPHTRTRWT